MKKRVYFFMTAAVIVSMAAFVSCKKDKPTPVITITTQPTASTNVTVGSISGSLSVTASVTEKAMLAYQWYSNTTNSNTSGTEIGGATTASYDIPTNLAAGTYYYFCEVRATGAASVRSSVATVTVAVPDYSVFDEGVVIGGVTWATRNVGAFGKFVAKPEDAGMFYQWNRSKAWPATGSVTGWDATASTATTWEAANDPCPPGWQVPTKSQFDVLIAAGSVWGPYNGVAGRKFGSGTNVIFLPAAGERIYSNGGLNRVGTNGYYWMFEQSDASSAPEMGFGSSSSGSTDVNAVKSFGHCIRCVKK